MRSQAEPNRSHAFGGVSRRSALAGLGAAAVTVLVAGCADSPSPPGATTALEPLDTSTSAAVVEDADKPVALPPVSPWTPGPGEVQPEIKVVAARLVEVAGTWEEGRGGGDAAAERLSGAGFDPALAGALARLVEHGAEQAVVDIVYPQYGGLTPEGASVIVALDQALLLPDGTTAARGMTLDVRLSPSPTGWTVTAVGPDQPPVGPGAPTALGEKVLSDPRVILPADAMADIRAGTVHDSVLAVLDGLARDHTVEVLTFSTGHPVHVFGTDRQSKHSLGRAVDIWRVDGAPVVDPSTSRDLLAAVMTKAGQLGATEIGGPFDLNGERPRYFSDELHKDHIHIGVTEGRSPAVP